MTRLKRLFIGLFIFLAPVAADNTKMVTFEVYPPDAKIEVIKAVKGGKDFVGVAPGPLRLSKEEHFGEDGEATFVISKTGWDERTVKNVLWTELSSSAPFQTGVRLEPDGSDSILVWSDSLHRNPLAGWALGGSIVLLCLGIAIGIRQRKIGKRQKEEQERIEIFKARGLNELHRFGNYYLLEQIGSGGMATVYRAARHDAPDEKDDVALKRIMPKFSQDKEYQERFRREVAATSLLIHPSVIKILDFGEEEGCLFFAMECLSGSDLYDLVEEKGDKKILPLEQALDIINQAAEGLTHAHGNSLVHRDINLRNIFYTADGRTVIIDFGCVRDPRVTYELTQQGQFMGTIGFFPPEILESSGNDDFSKYYTQAYDQFAFACTAYRLLSTEIPFLDRQGKTSHDNYASIYFDSIRPIHETNEELTEEMSAVFQKAMSKNPEDRYRSVRAFAQALTEAAKARATLPA